GLVHPGGQPEPELKYALDRAVWGGGLATEVAGAMLEYARSVLGLAAVIATIARENAASIRIVERLGMTRSTPRVEDDGSITEVYTIQLNTTGSTDALG
ncbi:MAG: GNAT family N-acetyltransferase, partial [Phycisphaerales bacterium]|nr:GNAT family N-acetyltransferase [Phycisphaerales bacterium]